MEFIYPLVIIVVTFFYIPMGINNVIKKYNNLYVNIELVYLINLGVIPILLSLLYVYIINFIGLKTYHAQWIIIGFVTLIISFLKGNKGILLNFFSIIKIIQTDNKFDALSLRIFIVCSIVLLYFITHYPIIANDPLEYLKVAEIINNRHNTFFYPIFSGSTTGGFIAPWSHLIGYPALISWVNPLITKIDGTQIYPKIINLIYLWYMYLLLIWSANKIKLTYKHVAPFLFSITPIVLHQVFDCHIDLLRMYLFTAGLCGLYFVIINKDTFFGLLFLSLILISNLFIHALGYIALAIVLLLYGVCSYSPIIERIKNVFIIMIIIGCILGYIIWHQTVQNNMVGDISNIGILKNSIFENYTQYLMYARDIFSLDKKIINGIFSIWSYYKLYGVLPWMILVSGGFILCNIRQGKIRELFYVLKTHRLLLLLCCSIILFFGVIVLTVLLGSIEMIKNIRYVLQVLPVLYLLSAFLIEFAIMGFKFSVITTDRER